MIKENLKRVVVGIKKFLMSKRNASLWFSISIFVSLCMLYAIAYQGREIHFNHVENQAKLNQSIARLHKTQSKVTTNHAVILDDHTDVLVNHSNVQNAQRELIMDHSLVLNDHAGILDAQTEVIVDHAEVLNDHAEFIKEQQKQLRRLESIVNNLQKKLGYDGIQTVPRTEI